MAGRFAEGVGPFYGDHVFETKPVRVRFIWSRDAATRCRWQQAFSADAGRSWETNWIMDFSRSLTAMGAPMSRHLYSVPLSLFSRKLEIALHEMALPFEPTMV